MLCFIGVLVSFLCAVCSYSGCFTQWFCFYVGGRVCVLLTDVHFLQCSEYRVISMFVSIMCTLFLLILYRWYFSNVFKCFRFLCVLIMFIVSAKVAYVYVPCLICALSTPFTIIIYNCLYIFLVSVWNVLPVCPMYSSGQSRHFIRYSQFFSICYVRGCYFCMFLHCFSVCSMVFFLVMLCC
jgi:hypothetical protein